MRVPTASAIFDDYLVRLFFSFQSHPTLWQWVRATEPVTRSELAEKVLYELIIKRGTRPRKSPVLSSKGCERIPKMIGNIRKFEGLIERSRTRFRGKIYRDHLDHMIRTALLARYLSSIQLYPERRGTHKEQRLQIVKYRELSDDLVIAALFHDACYPVEEARKIIDDLLKELEKVYKLLSFPKESDKPTSKGFPRCQNELSSMTGIKGKKLHDKLFKDPDHAVVGAFEFLSCCNACSKRALRIASAILLHNPGLAGIIRFKENPLAVLLILADELQDWGRPVAHTDLSYRIPLEELEVPDFLTSRRIPRRMLKGEFIFRFSERDFPLFEVIHSKYTNLRRLRLQGLRQNISLRFPLSPGLSVSGIRSRYLRFLHAYTIGKHKKPWCKGETYLDDSQMAERTELKKKYVKTARETLVNMGITWPITVKNLKWMKDVDDWNLYKYGDSNNYLVVSNEIGVPTEIQMIIIRKRFQLQLNSTSFTNVPKERLSISSTGELVHLNELAHKKEILGPVKPIPLLIRLTESRMREPGLRRADIYLWQHRTLESTVLETDTELETAI